VRIIGVLYRVVIGAWHYRARHKARQLAAALESGWHVTCTFEAYSRNRAIHYFIQQKVQ
jgi:hypothetical protein